MEFKAMKTTKKGLIGEKIVRSLLEEKGLIIYECNQDRGHLVDFFAARPGRCLFGVEVKCKARKAFTPTTGIDSDDYRTYLRLLNQGIDTVLFFVDPFEAAIYYAKISALADMQPASDLITYFPLDWFTLERSLTRGELRELDRFGAFDPVLYQNTTKFFTDGIS